MTTQSLNDITNNQNDENPIRELFHKIQNLFGYLLSKWIVILACCIMGGLLGLSYAWTKKPNYTATTTFVLEDEGTSSVGLGNIGGLASMVGVDLGGGGGGIFQGDNILELYRSRTMIEKTLLTEVEYIKKKQLLVDCYIDFNNLREKWIKNEELKNIQFSGNYSLKTNSNYLAINRLRDSILGVIVNDINKNYLNVAKLDKKSSIIMAEVKADDEVFAKAFNDAIVKNVNDFYMKTKTKKSLDNITILQQKVDSVRTVMNGAIYSAAAVTDATANLNPTRQVQRMVPVQRSQFTAETNKIILGELVKNLELSKITLRKEMPLIQVVDIPIYPLRKVVLSRTTSTILGILIGAIISFVFLSFKYIYKTVLK
jgi:hypothetical protein